MCRNRGGPARIPRRLLPAFCEQLVKAFAEQSLPA